MKTMLYKGSEFEVKKGSYLENKNLALVLVDQNTGEVFANITTNGEIKLPPDVALVKNYSENDSMLAALETAGLIKKIIGFVPSGFVTFPIVQFNLEGIEDIHKYNNQKEDEVK